MANYQSIVDQIQAFVRAADQTNSPELGELALQYAALCTEANTRLRRCTDFLRRGLRSEAIHVAEEHPVLLELVGVLDLKELAEWATLCANYDLTRPVPLLIEAAQELNEAYAVEQPLQVLLDKHRRLALERAPLPQRIEVMRQLAELDKISPFWEEDLRTFETARMKAMRFETASAIKKADRPAITALLGELQKPGWRVEIPADLATSLTRAQSGFAYEETVRWLEQMMHDLDLAYGAMDLQAVTASVTNIRALATSAKMDLPPQLEARLRPAEQWCRAEHVKAIKMAAVYTALGDLTQAIDRAAPEAELLRYRNAFLEHGDPVPEELAYRLDTEIARQRKEAQKRSRRRTMVLVGSLLVFLAVGAGVLWFVKAEERVQEARDKLNRLCDEKNFAAIDTEISRLNSDWPSVLRNPEVIKVRDRIEDARKVEQAVIDQKQKADQARIASFTSSVDWARKAIDVASASNNDDEPTWEPATKYIREAEQFSRTPAEKRQLQSLSDQLAIARGKARDAANKRMDALDAKLAQDIKRLESRASEIEAMSAAEKPLAGSADLNSATREANDVLAQVPSDELHRGMRESVGRVIERLRVAGQSSEKRAMERSALASIRGATKSPKELADALTQFAKQCPDSDRAGRFLAAASLLSVWTAVDEYDSLTKRWIGSFRPAISVVPNRLQAIREHRQKLTEGPWSAPLPDYLKYLISYQTTNSAQGAWKSNFKQSLAAPVIRELSYLKTTQGWCYYLKPKETPVETSPGLSFNFVKTANLAKTKLVTISRANLVGGGLVLPSPQSVLADELTKLIDAQGSEWENFAFDVASRVVNAKEVDAILKAHLLTLTLEAWSACDWGTGNRLPAIIKGINKLTEGTGEWIDPDNVDSMKMRSVIAQQLPDILKELKVVRDGVWTQREALRRQMEMRLVGRGVLLEEAKGWTIYTADKLLPGSRAFVAGTTAGWGQVAEYRDGQFVIDLKAVEKRLDGMMVFFLPPESATSTRPSTPGR